MIGSSKALLQAAAGAGGASIEWNLSYASYTSVTFSINISLTNEGSVKDLFFKSDGTRMYITGWAGDAVHEYDLSTAWDITTASLAESFSISNEESNAEGLFFKPDGTKMYVVGSNGDDVNEYDLSTAWDVSTSTYNQNFDVSNQEAVPTGISFKSDGTKMYISGRSSNDAVYEYTLSTAWDISTASYSQNFSFTSQDTNPQGIYFRDDGIKLYMVGSSTDTVYEYTLSTAWDISTASYTNRSISVQSQDAGPMGVFFKDGTEFYVAGLGGDKIYKYTISST